MNDDSKDSPADDATPEAAFEAADAADSLEAKLAAAEKARDEMKDLAQRTMADFQNYRARALKDAQASKRFAVKDAVAAVLPAFDNLERALAAAEAPKAGLDALKDGVTMTRTAFVDGLTRLGVLRVEAKGAAFDPSTMEAIARLETADHPAGSVLDEWESGWRLGDLVVRHARVSVAAAPKPAEADAPASPESETA